jgi:phosphatidylglycerophosphate synthase
MVKTGMKKDDTFYQAQLKKDRKGFWARYLNVENWINRPLASVLVSLVFRTPVTPNQLTIIAFIFAMGGAALFATGTAAGAMGAAILCEVALVFDCADGLLARARKASSRFGYFFVLLGVVAGFYRAGGEDKNRLILGLFIISLYMLQVILYYISNRFHDVKNGESGEGRAFGILYIFVMGMLNRLDLIVYGMLAETVLNLIYRISCFLLTGWKSERQQLPL